jgi:hypothetical protein
VEATPEPDTSASGADQAEPAAEASAEGADAAAGDGEKADA